MGKTFQTYPAIRYHKELAPDGRTVVSAAAEAELGEGWVKTPAAFAPGYVEVPEPADGTPYEDVAPVAKEYIHFPVMYYGPAGQELTVFTAEQEEGLSSQMWRRSPADWVGGQASPSPAPAAASSEPPVPAPLSALAESLYYLNVDESKRLVTGAKTAEALAAIEAAEQAHPKHPGGRVSVLKAIDERRAELAA